MYLALTPLECSLDLSQRQLAGLAAATIDFLLLSIRLPLPFACSEDEINSISAFLCYLMQVSLLQPFSPPHYPSSSYFD